MKTILHKADTRGHADFGWLNTRYTFSFASYYDPNRINFGALRVLNDDHIEGGKGFGRHPHDNMEIVTIPLEGALEHKDSMNHTQVLKKNEVQVMSAGTGIFHSEYNKYQCDPLELLQIWILPKKTNVTPRYDQKEFDPAKRIDQWQRLVSPDEPDALRLNQDAWFSRILLLKDSATNYSLHSVQNGIYVFVIEGEIQINDTLLSRRDGMGIRDISEITLTALTTTDVLLMEIPMNVI
jgi:quercetin 2,3-dioxygenase